MKILSDKGNDYVYMLGSSTTYVANDKEKVQNGLVYKIAMDNGEIVWTFKINNDRRQKISSTFIDALLFHNHGYITCVNLVHKTLQESFSFDVYRLDVNNGLVLNSPSTIPISNGEESVIDIPKKVFISNIDENSYFLCFQPTNDVRNVLTINKDSNLFWNVFIESRFEQECDDLVLIPVQMNYDENSEFVVNTKSQGSDDDDRVIVGSNEIVRCFSNKPGSKNIWEIDLYKEVLNGDTKSDIVISDLEVRVGNHVSSIFISFQIYDKKVMEYKTYLYKIGVVRGSILWKRAVTNKNGDAINNRKLRGSLQINEVNNQAVRLLVWSLGRNSTTRLQSIYVTDYNKNYNADAVAAEERVSGNKYVERVLSNWGSNVKGEREIRGGSWGFHSTLVYYYSKVEKIIQLSIIQYKHKPQATEVTSQNLKTVQLTVYLLASSKALIGSASSNGCRTNISLGNIADVSSERLQAHLLKTRIYEAVDSAGRVSFSTWVCGGDGEIFEQTVRALEELFSRRDGQAVSAIEREFGCRQGRNIIKVGEDMQQVMSGRWDTLVAKGSGQRKSKRPSISGSSGGSFVLWRSDGFSIGTLVAVIIGVIVLSIIARCVGCCGKAVKVLAVMKALAGAESESREGSAVS